MNRAAFEMIDTHKYDTIQPCTNIPRTAEKQKPHQLTVNGSVSFENKKVRNIADEEVTSLKKHRATQCSE